jgi:tRNA modification GTPase
MRRALCEIEGMRVVLLSWPGGRSYTGEEMLEVMCPGAPGAVEAVCRRLAAMGSRPARAGEFTRRALELGVMEPLEVIGLASLWGGGGPGGESQLAHAARRLAGTLDGALEGLEASIEFGEEHGLDETGEAPCLAAAARQAAELVALAGKAEIPLDVWIAGPVNSGKSTLLNRLCGSPRALVSGEPGSTRDGISVEAPVGGTTVILHDTAGFGGDALSESALGLSLGSISAGDLVIWLSRPGGPRPPAEAFPGGCVLLEIDGMCDLYEGGSARVSSVTGEGMEALSAQISSRASSGMVSGHASACARAVEEAGRLLRLGDVAAACEEIEGASAMLHALLDTGAGAETALERAMTRLCIGK